MRAWRRWLLKSHDVAERARGRVRERVRAWLRMHPATLPLEHVQRRLELVLTAMYGREIPIAPIERNVWNRDRVRHLAKGDIRGADATPSIDGKTIYLPVELKTTGDDAQTIARYRLYAIEQAERIIRGTVAEAPLTDPLERDLYLLRESAAIDAHIARAHPGVLDTLGAERRSALGRRPDFNALSVAEREVETLWRETLSSAPERLDAPSRDPLASRQWARETASRIRARGDKYRGLPPSSLWGALRTESNELPLEPDDRHILQMGTMDQTPQESDEGEGTGDTGKSPDAPANTQEHDPEGSSSRLPERFDEPTPWQQESRARDTTMAAPAGARSLLHPDEVRELPPAIPYDEWNVDRGAYVKRAAAVRLYEPVEGDARWAPETLRAHGATVRRIRHQFERLRARRTLLSRQRAGDELDIAACVNAVVDRRIGEAPDDRLYLDARPARRGLAISLLVDVSGSTDAQVTDAWRIIDLEKIALLLATQALDALGDVYAVYTFGGKTAEDVKLTVVKDFAERSGETVQRRIAALAPGGFTRMGAAVRHTTRQLVRQSAGHRLLLLLSDGRPNDVDVYQGPYGVEDARHAIFEARASGVYPFCLTIDRDASEYLPRIFGDAGHTILRRPEQLPTALVGVVRALIKR